MRALGFLMASILIAISPALGAADPAQPQPQSAAQQTAAPPAPEKVTVVGRSDTINLDEVTCRNEAPATGTRLGGGRECHTVREWKQRQERAQDTTRKAEIVGFVHH